MDTEPTVLLTRIEYPLVGNGVRRGSVRADSVLFDEAFRSARLIHPHLTVPASTTRPQQLDISADSGRLELGGARILLFQPEQITGASAELIGKDSVWYEPAGDSVWTASPPSG
ncbi:MAG: hypothetical protein ACRELX_05435 [Longimicrobiales bacterium]